MSLTCTTYLWVPFILANGTRKQRTTQRLILAPSEIKEEFTGYIEEELIDRIPTNHLEPILHFALNEEFALSYHKFLTGNFGLFDRQEIAIVRRLFDYLRNNSKI